MAARSIAHNLDLENVQCQQKKAIPNWAREIVCGLNGICDKQSVSLFREMMRKFDMIAARLKTTCSMILDFDTSRGNGNFRLPVSPVYEIFSSFEVNFIGRSKQSRVNPIPLSSWIMRGMESSS